MAHWYQKWSSVEDVRDDPGDKRADSICMSTQSSLLDDNFLNDLRAEIHRMEKVVPSQNCTRPSCVARPHRLRMQKKMSTLSDTCSVTISRSEHKVADNITRSSSLQDIRSPSPRNYPCSAPYCPVLDPRLSEARRWTEARKCTRWAKRRNALSNPHQMALPQSTRERIESDIALRKTSLQRKISQLFRTAVESEPEVDLT